MSIFYCLTIDCTMLDLCSILILVAGSFWSERSLHLTAEHITSFSLLLVNFFCSGNYSFITFAFFLNSFEAALICFCHLDTVVHVYSNNILWNHFVHRNKSSIAVSGHVRLAILLFIFAILCFCRMSRPDSARSRAAWSSSGRDNDAFQASTFGSRASELLAVFSLNSYLHFLTVCLWLMGNEKRIYTHFWILRLNGKTPDNYMYLHVLVKWNLIKCT